MSTPDLHADLRRYLELNVQALRWKLEGCSEYDLRRPLVATGTNLLGLVKHVASVAAGYFGDTFDRPFGESLPWFAEDAEPNADLWATAEESSAELLALYDRVWDKAFETIDALPLDAEGTVPWWTDNPVTLGRVMVHMAVEVARHAGQADIVRELVDGAVGLREANTNLWHAPTGWDAHRDRVEAAAQRFR